MENKPSILVTQSFICTQRDTYWDYRDYVFSLVSNPGLRHAAIRLNIEKGTEFAEEFRQAAAKNGFTDVQITTQLPASWGAYMLEQIKGSPSDWVMPWPGDHIYIHPNDQAYIASIQKAEQLGADAIVYGHMQDFEYFLDWDRVPILYDDPEYVMVRWGNKYRYRRNPQLKKAALRVIGQELIMTPVPAFMTFKSKLLKDILEALPPHTTRWQDMEYSTSSSAWDFKVLIPKQCLYRHVHGYWLEGFFKYENGGVFPQDRKAEIQSWYVRPQYDWRTSVPTTGQYREMCLQAYPYFQRYFQTRTTGQFTNAYGHSPFEENWQRPAGLFVSLRRMYKNSVQDVVRKWGGKLRKVIKR